MFFENDIARDSPLLFRQKDAILWSVTGDRRYAEAKEHGEETSMREYQTGMREERVLSKVVCNGCGREIPLRGADYFHAEKTWGYFSEQDGRQDAFDLCEECYRKMTEGFRIKIEEK